MRKTVLSIPLTILFQTAILPAQIVRSYSAIVVAPDKSGDAQSIQQALDAIPGERLSLTIINVRNGLYREKLYLTKSNVAIVGESRDSTRILFPVLRSEWNAANGGSDWGSAVVNIGDGVKDVIFANLSIRNTYGDSTGNHDHQFAIRGFNATRISLLYCNVSSAGGDAVSLWNRDSGMYYHAFSSFEGWVDYVCPRGWCYITDSRFFGHNRPSASIWHDGSTHNDQKFVIRNSTFDGVPGFPLGRHHRDAQFFLLDCTFSENMADKPLYAPRSPSTVHWKWGARHYFWNCSRPAGNYGWFADNLNDSEECPDEDDVNASWTFGGRWDPERLLPSVLPFASIPRPRNSAYDVPSSRVRLGWLKALNERTRTLLIGENPTEFREIPVGGNSYITDTLKAGTRYFWKVRSFGGDRPVDSDLWTFTTAR